jgi:PAS domain S-box-containing protein
MRSGSTAGPRPVVIGAALIAAAAFALDVTVPLGVAAAVPYLGLVLLASLGHDERWTLGAAAFGTLLLALGAWLSPHTDAPWHAALDRSMGLVALWGTSAVALLKHRSEARHHTARLELERSQQKLLDLKYALDQACPVERVDPSGRILEVNERFCELSGYSRQELIHQDHRILRSGHHPAAFMAELWRTVAAGEVWRGEILNRARDGRPFWVDTTIVPLLDGAGRPRQYVVVRTDVTGRKVAEAALREQESLARLGEMAAVVAHEVKNPLTGISGALQIIRRKLPDDAAEQQVIDDILARIGSLDEAVRDMLVYARPRPPQMKRVAVRPILDSAAAQVQSDRGFAGVDVIVRPCGDQQLLVDPALLQQALLNVMLNASQAMKGQGTITLQAQAVPQGCEISVADTGPGIDDSAKEQVFQPFFTTRHRGTGLGLAVVRRTVEAHGGSVAIGSRPEGGAVVTLTLPTADGAARAQEG